MNKRSRAVRLATFNLESFGDRPGAEPSLAARIAVLAPALDRLDADILCLQEVNAQKTGGEGPRGFAALDALLDAAGLDGYARAATTNRAGTGPADIHNLVTLARAPILESRQVWHDLVPPPRHVYVTAKEEGTADVEITWDRPVLYTRVGLKGGAALHLFNVHLRAPLASPVPGQKTGEFAWASVAGWAEGYYLSELRRAGQAFELRLALDRIFADQPQALVAIAGDFNAEEHHAPLDIIRGEVDNTGNGALAGSEMIPLEHAVDESRRFTVIHQGRRQMLDHVLVSRPLMGRFEASEIHNEALTDELTGHGAVEASPVSYHAPVLAVFDLELA